MGTEISVQGFDRGGKRKTEGDSERTVRMARDNDIGRGNKGRSCAYVFVSTSETFSIVCDEGTEGEKF